MFTFIGSIHLAILTHCHNNNIHNNIDNNNNNNTVSAKHTQKCLSLLPTPTEVAFYATVCPTLQAIYTIQMTTLSNTFL